MTAEQAALSASGGPISGSDIRRQEELGITPSGGQGWVDPNAPVPGSFEDYIQQGANLPHKDFWDRIPATGVAPTGGGQGWVNPNAPFDPSAPVVGGAPAQDTTLAPQYSEESPGYQTHNQMYPGHRNAAAMAGVASIRAQFDGTHKAWIEGINKDMEKREIVLDHAINGVRTGKHSSGNWKEYNDLFTVGEDGVPRDSNGVAMFGTDKQAQAGIGGVLQGLWGGVLSGAQNLFKPKTSSGAPAQLRYDIDIDQYGKPRKDMLGAVSYGASGPHPGIESGYMGGIQNAQEGRTIMDLGTGGNEIPVVDATVQPTVQGAEDPYANLGYPDYASGNIPDNIRQAATVGDDTRGDHPVDMIRSTYTWAASLPNSVLFNAARYPDYLRLLIEYDAAGKDLPLEVPTWILEGTARPAEDNEEIPSYATQQQLSWATPAWMT
tara:strand:+ start:22 stop:1329 length:1308 start_codon:yes stop_codon:yes gene_type:complete